MQSGCVVLFADVAAAGTSESEAMMPQQLL